MCIDSMKDQLHCNFLNYKFKKGIDEYWRLNGVELSGVCSALATQKLSTFPF